MGFFTHSHFSEPSDINWCFGGANLEYFFFSKANYIGWDYFIVRNHLKTIKSIFCLEPTSKIIDKISFYVREPFMYDHYKNIWAHLDRKTFDIILDDRLFEEKYSSFRSLLDKLEYSYISKEIILNKKLKYKYLVTNHNTGKEKSNIDLTILKQNFSTIIKNIIKNIIKRFLNTILSIINSRKRWDYTKHAYQYFQNICSLKRIRFMYGADLSEYSISNWNKMFDLILTHGPNDTDEIKKRYSIKTIQMGYPRYDEYPKIEERKNNILESFKCNKSKQTIVWLPTFSHKLDTIPKYYRGLSHLLDRYNIIVRPHPITYRLRPNDISLLKNYRFIINDNEIQDMCELYAIADYVFCDYGGTAFSAVYLDCRILLLNSTTIDNISTLKCIESADLRKYLVNINPDKANSIAEIMKDEKLWKKQDRIRAEIKKIYFADKNWKSSEYVANVLQQLDQII